MKSLLFSCSILFYLNKLTLSLYCFRAECHVNGNPGCSNRIVNNAIRTGEDCCEQKSAVGFAESLARVGKNPGCYKCNRCLGLMTQINGNWGAWSTWDVCSKTCGDDGFQIRRRICDSPAPLKLGMECLGPEIERIVCNDNPCPLVRGQWSEWSDWSKCSKYCGIGEMIRTRVCNSQIQAQCDGSAEQSRKCVLIENCPIDGDWGVWSAWTTCSKSCGKGKMFRTRECDNPAPADGGKECEGHKKYSLECVLIENCPIDGGWGDWSAPTKCSKSCGRGESNQYRSCDNPTPQFRGKNCTGHSVKSVVCNSKPCPIHGRWSAWSAYSACILDDCNDHSKGGHQTRSRSCNNPSPKFGGKMCTGKMIEKVRCMENDNCPRDGEWSEWGFWQCSDTGAYRVRECLHRRFEGRYCPGNNIIVKPMTDTTFCTDCKSNCRVTDDGKLMANTLYFYQQKLEEGRDGSSEYDHELGFDFEDFEFPINITFNDWKCRYLI